MRSLQQNARAVACVFLAATGAAVFQIEENSNRLVDDVVGLAAVQIDDKTNAAGIVFELRIV